MAFDQLLKVLGDFMRTIILQKSFQFDVICFTGYGVIAEKLHIGHLGQFFYAPCRKNYTIHWIDK